MVIDRIGNINKVVGSDNIRSNSAKDVQSAKGQDSVSISKEAQQAQEMAQVLSTVRQAPDIRQERVKEVKEKLARGDYDSPEIELLEKVAEKIADAITRN
ncbi:MAG: flagellar biosynthesis anti-sigma factor FlgM [Leptospirales bacterium]